jgi:hypothetical protein
MDETSNPKISWRLSFLNSFSLFHISGLRDVKLPDPLSTGSPVCRNTKNISALILPYTFRDFMIRDFATPAATFLGPSITCHVSFSVSGLHEPRLPVSMTLLPLAPGIQNHDEPPDFLTRVLYRWTFLISSGFHDSGVCDAATPRSFDALAPEL